jgi:hypothetical protein
MPINRNPRPYCIGRTAIARVLGSACFLATIYFPATGGADGRDVFVTQADNNNILIERFRTDRPGREPCLQTPTPADCRPIAP